MDLVCGFSYGTRLRISLVQAEDFYRDYLSTRVVSEGFFNCQINLTCHNLIHNKNMNYMELDKIIFYGSFHF